MGGGKLEIELTSDKKTDQCVWVVEVCEPPGSQHTWAVCGGLM